MGRIGRRARLDLEVPQQPLEAATVSVVLLPAREVADVALPPQQPRPGFLSFQHRVVDPDREQDGALALALPLLVQAARHLAFHPIARDRALREHQQHLVPQPDGFIDRVQGLGAAAAATVLLIVDVLLLG